MKAAVLGMGLIGAEWAKNLEADGVLAATWNRSPRPDAPQRVDSVSEAVSRAEIVHLVVADELSALEVVKQCEHALGQGHVVIQSTTIDATTSNAIKVLVEKCGARYLEAPFTGSLPAAKERQTVYYLGGEQSVIDECLPYLQHLSQKQFVIGTNEQACRLKLNMNLLISAQMIALTEALASSRAGGISDEVFFAALSANASSSGVSKLKEPKLRAGDFSPQFSVKHMAKDMRLLGLMSQTATMHEACLRVLNMANERDLGDEDISAMIKLLS
jgi:3-hydroxyisobutyrate dehydrogenase-like beta-hydroxyacid dehydrogenase